MPNYTYRLEHADSKQAEKRGASTASEILSAFDAFDWTGEVAKANDIQERSPTFGVEDAESGREFWVSAYGDPSEFQLVSHYAFPVRKKAWFGLVERDAFSGPNCRQDLSLSEARQALSLFLDSNHEGLVRLVSTAS